MMMMNRILRFLVTICKEQKRELAQEMAMLLLEYSPTYETYVDKFTLKHRMCQSLRPFYGFDYDSPPKVLSAGGGAWSLLDGVIIVILFIKLFCKKLKVYKN